MWDPDARHMHHVFKRKLGSVKSAVLAIYAMGACFAGLGVVLGWLSLSGSIDRKWIYIVFLAVFGVVGFIGVRMGLTQRSNGAKAT